MKIQMKLFDYKLYNRFIQRVINNFQYYEFFQKSLD